MRVQEVKAKSIITKTKLPDGDFVINPYIGCTHGCRYCYARFMKRFTGHTEPWGSFVDVKINAPDLVPKDTGKYKHKRIIVGSVTDPYQPLEKKHKLTRRILEKLIPLQPQVNIMTKSSLVLRDIDLLKQFKKCIVAVSLATLEDTTRKKLEPLAPSVERRIGALERLYKEKIETALFISPIFPWITDWKKIINKTKNFVDEYWFENLNFYPSIRGEIYKILKEINPDLVDKYQEIYSKNNNYWNKEAEKIEKFCRSGNISSRIYFHH